jgi:class 3 adenylate cyclase/hemoglobin-like flavoprotein
MAFSITFQEASNHEVAAESSLGGSILDVALALKLPHVHDCGGKARCSTCRVRVVNGVEHLPARNSEEQDIAQTYGWSEEIRLACQTIPTGPISVERLVRAEDRRVAPDDENLTTRSEERQLAVLFCDINGFTDFAQGCMPYDVVHVVNRLFLKIGEAVFANGGYIDKYLGDGLLALWGMHGAAGEDSCLSAVRAGLLMQRWVREIGPLVTHQIGRELSLRVGIHFGPAIVGRIGHPARQQTTAIGDTVNVASRVEAANKDLRTHFLVSEECYEQVRAHVVVGDDFKTILRGQNRPRRLFEITGLTNPDAAFITQSQINRISSAGEEFVSRFYSHLFRLDPGVESLFPREGMPHQHHRFLQHFTGAVRELRQPARLTERLHSLGGRHRGYGVVAGHFPVAGKALLAAIVETLGEEFDDDTASAWQAVFGEVARLMQQGPPIPRPQSEH